MSAVGYVRGIDMVHVKDEAIFDAPLEKIWRFLQHDKHEHKGFKIAKVLERTDRRMVVEADVKNPNGKGTHKETWKFTFNPPTGFDIEYTSGPMTGTRHTHAYTSMGPKTKVEVSGEFHIQGLDEAATRKAVLAFLDDVYNEDVAALKQFS